MTTALLVAAAVVLVVLLVAVVVECATNPLMWVLHTLGNTVGVLLELLAAVVGGIFQAVTGASS